MTKLNTSNYYVLATQSWVVFPLSNKNIMIINCIFKGKSMANNCIYTLNKEGDNKW
jgi:hypothetical protein